MFYSAACRFVRELAAGLENQRKTTLVRVQQAEIEVAGAKAISEVAAAIAADLAEWAENAIGVSPAAEPADQPADVIEPDDCDGELA